MTSLRSIPDTELERVAQALLADDPWGDRFARVFRDSLDQLLDGNRNGRWSYADLLQTEKTHMGTIIEINLAREFGWDAGDDDPTDYRIDGVLVDCKFSGTGAWMIGPELVGFLLLVLSADDQTSTWRAGLVRADAQYLRRGANRDKKVGLNREGATRIRWLWPAHGRLEENLLLHLRPDLRERIMGALGRRGTAAGQARLNQLCREVQGRILRRAVIETVGHGLDDPLKRMRSNGGARDQLRPEGIVVLGHQDNDPLVAQALELPVPRKGEFIAVRVTRADSSIEAAWAEIAGQLWRAATPADPVDTAPVVPRRRAAN
jgi:Restriction endonuclease NaeI